MNHHQAPLASDWHRVNHKYSVQFIMTPPANGTISLNIEWAPHLPTAHEAKLLHNQYRKARDQFLASFAQSISATIGVVELPA